MASKTITIDLTPNYENIIRVMELQRGFMTAKQWEKSPEKKVLDECLKSRN